MKRHHRPKFALAIAAMLLLAFACSARSSASTVGSSSSHVTVQRVPAILVAAPSGLVVVLKTSDLYLTDSWKKAIDNPSIQGVALQIHWSDIQGAGSSPGYTDWGAMDALFAEAQKSKKWVQLLIFPGFFTPAWALKGVQTETFPIQYGPGAGTPMKLPMPWDSVYLNKWLTFVKEVSDRYAGSPALTLVAASGPTSVSAEFTLPNSPADLKKWQTDGYTPTKYIGAWRTVLSAFASDFPNQYISLSQGEGLDINDQGKIDHSEHLRTRQAIVDLASKTLGHRFALQLSDVHAGPTRNGPNSEAEEQFVIGYIGRAVTGFQLRTNALHNSAVMGAKGNPPSALSKSIALAAEPNGAGRIVNYVEIYEPDVLAPTMQKVLKSDALLCFSGSQPHGLCVPPAVAPPVRH